MKNYLTYPCKVMNITQGYAGNYSHGPHTTGTPKDYPWDEACENTGRSPMYCPCDEMKIVRIYTKGTNTIWLESTSEVYFADGTSDYVTLMVTHPNDNDIARLKVGRIFKRGEPICHEGTDGNATGNHFHFAVGKGQRKGNGWAQNSNKKWVLTTTNGSKKPETMFYIDPEFTTIKKSNSLQFKELPQFELPERGYFKKGDTGEDVEKINTFLFNIILSFVEKVEGELFGENTEFFVKEFQRRTNLEQDGCIGPITLAEMKKYGFNTEE